MRISVSPGVSRTQRRQCCKAASTSRSSNKTGSPLEWPSRDEFEVAAQVLLRVSRGSEDGVCAGFVEVQRMHHMQRV